MPTSRIAILASLLMLTSFACGGSGKSETSASEASATTSTEASTPKAAPARDTPSVEEHAADSEEMDSLGARIENLESYLGLYANPETPDRQWFVTEAKRPRWAEQAPEIPPGHLALGAMFGDVQPWTLKTLSDTDFEQVRYSEGDPPAAVIRFELGDDGQAVAMSFLDERHASQGRLERVGDLPEDLVY